MKKVASSIGFCFSRLACSVQNRPDPRCFATLTAHQLINSRSTPSWQQPVSERRTIQDHYSPQTYFLTPKEKIIVAFPGKIPDTFKAIPDKSLTAYFHLKIKAYHRT
jgi:hypothetical protein